MGGLKTRSVLGGSGLGGDDLDGSIDELPAMTMGAFFASAGVQSRRCFRRHDLVSAGVRRDRCNLGLGSVLGVTSQCF